MKIFLVISLFFASISFANSENVFTCGSTGDSLESVIVTADGDSFKIEVVLPSGKTEVYSASKTTPNTLLGRSAKSEDFSGATSDAVLLSVSKGDGYLARKGLVYQLRCR